MFYKGIILDLFGTIIPRPSRELHSAMIRDMSNVLGVETSKMHEAWHSKFEERINGKGGSPGGFIQLLMEDMGISADSGSAAELARMWHDLTSDLFVYFQDVEPCLERCEKAGMKTALLSNCGAVVPSIFRKTRVDDLMNVSVFSSEEGVHKPDPRIFDIACRRLDIHPRQVVFIGDGDSNELQGARNCGIDAVKLDRGSIAGDYRLTEDLKWKPTINDLNEIPDILGSLFLG